LLELLLYKYKRRYSGLKDYEKVRGTEKPDSKVVDDYSVWINKNI
jgi:hypothetical protein